MSNLALHRVDHVSNLALHKVDTGTSNLAIHKVDTGTVPTCNLAIRVIWPYGRYGTYPALRHSGCFNWLTCHMNT